MKRLALMFLATTWFGPVLGCTAIRDVLGDHPTVTFKSARLDGMDLQRAAIAFDLEVSNPYPAALPLTQIKYALGSGGAAIAQGVFDPPQRTIPARGRSVVTVPVTLPYADVMRALSHVKPGVMLPYDATVDLMLQPPMLEAIPFTLSRSGQLPVPAMPDVSLNQLEWRELSVNRASGVLDLRVRNTNQFAVNLASLVANLSLGASPVASATTPTSLSLSPGGTGSLRVPFDVSTTALGMQLVSMLRGGDVSYALDGQVTGSTPAGPLTLPFQAAGQAPMTRR